jgi:DNA-binding response OmpR family regulator
MIAPLDCDDRADRLHLLTERSAGLPADAASFRAMKAKSDMTTQKRILLVDDDRPFLDLLEMSLATHEARFGVLCAGNGREALRILDETPVSLLVTDLNMPEMDGFELLTALTTRHANIPVIVMSSSFTPSGKSSLRRIGDFSILSKPFAIPAMTSMILTELEGASEGFVRGLNLASFLQLIESEQKTSTLKITSDGRVGYFYFQRGVLVDAEADAQRGVRAAAEILHWDNPTIQIISVCHPTERIIYQSLSELLLDSYRRLDESNRDAEDAPPVISHAEADDASSSHTTLKENIMGNIKECLQEALQIDGALGTALGDWKTGMCLGTVGTDSAAFPARILETAVAGNTEVIRAKMSTAQSLGLPDKIENILIELSSQYHLVRVCESIDGLFLYIVLDRAKSNLALARIKLVQIEKKLSI